MTPKSGEVPRIVKTGNDRRAIVFTASLFSLGIAIAVDLPVETLSSAAIVGLSALVIIANFAVALLSFGRIVAERPSLPRLKKIFGASLPHSLLLGGLVSTVASMTVLVCMILSLAPHGLLRIALAIVACEEPSC